MQNDICQDSFLALIFFKPLTRVTKSYLLALGTTQISSSFTKHWTKFLTHQTGNYPVTCFVSKPSRITLVELSIINTNCDGSMTCDQGLVSRTYPIIALFQPSQAKEQRVAGEILTISPPELSIRSIFCVYTFPDRRCAESALSAVRIPGEPPLLREEASSNPILPLNDWCWRRRIL